MLSLIKKMLQNDKIRYLVAGGCTTCVNIIAFFLLRNLTQIDRNICNAIAIAMAIAFAYFANKFFVFRSKSKSLGAAVIEALSFVGMRLISMVVEILGFAIMCDSFRVREVFAKILVQFVVLVLNYVFSKLIVFKKDKRSLKDNFRENYVCYISFAIVAVVMLGVFIAMKIMPFGTHTLTVVDSLHQYVPFFAEYRHKLLNEGSLFYTWNNALGANFMSLTAYYIASPFNFLVILFSKEAVPMVMSILMALKVCISAATMAYYLSNKDKKKNTQLYIIPIAVCYALSNYVVGYYWNVMWMDCIMIFPIIILGFQRLMEKGDPRMYALSMFYALYCNYYIGFMLCIFMVLWFFVYNHGGIKKFFVHGIRFGIYSLASGGMAAFLLIPAYLGIMSTASADAKLPVWKWYGNIFEQFNELLFMSDAITNQTFDGGINLYCGMLAVFTVFLYLFVGKISLWEKLKKLLLLSFLMISFNNELLNFIWHGFHNQYGIPNRFSFLFIFVLLVMAYDAIKNVKRVHYIYIISCGLFAGSFVFLCRMYSGAVTPVMLYGSLVLIAVYTLLCGLFSAKKIKRGAFNYALCTACLMDILICSISSFSNNGYADAARYYSTTPQVTAANEEVERLAKEQGAGFYRSELMDSKTLDEATWHNMPSVGTFCSTVLGEPVTTMGRLGFYTGANEFLYMGATPFTNSLLNVRYLLEREGDLNNFDFDYVTTVEGVGIYENPYPLALGFTVLDAVKDWNRDYGNPEGCQCSLANYMTGCANFFTPAFADFLVTSEDCTVELNGNSISYRPIESGEASIMVSFTIEKPGDYYLNCRGSNITKMKFFIDGQEYAYDRYQSQLFHLGELEAGQYINVEYCYNSLSNPGTASLYMFTFELDKYEDVYNELADNLMDVQVVEDGYVYGTVNMPENETLFTSIPYDEGWSLKVDGKAAKYYAIGETFIGIDMTPGQHTIEMVYYPRGLKIGMIISAFSWIVLILGTMYNNNKKDKVNIVKNDNKDIDRNANI